MIAPNWSVKAEGLYYDLGRVQFVSSPTVIKRAGGCRRFVALRLRQILAPSLRAFRRRGFDMTALSPELASIITLTGTARPLSPPSKIYSRTLRSVLSDRLTKFPPLCADRITVLRPRGHGPVGIDLVFLFTGNGSCEGELAASKTRRGLPSPFLAHRGNLSVNSKANMEEALDKKGFFAV